MKRGEIITDKGKLKYVKKNLLQCRFFFTTNPTLIAALIKLILLGENPATNLVQGTAKSGVSEIIEHSW
jgi:hypothetical protein